jgi:serine/threonine protein phosphatase PrpC
MVADGVATSTNGGAAAQLAIELLPEYVRRHLTQQNLAGPDGAAGFGEAVAHVSDDMHERGQTDSIIAGASTTIVAAVIASPLALFAHLGDSRAYLHRDQSVQQLTRDHTLIQTPHRRAWHRRGEYRQQSGAGRDHPVRDDDACRALIDAANRGGGPDNVTAVVIDVR